MSLEQPSAPADPRPRSFVESRVEIEAPSSGTQVVVPGYRGADVLWEPGALRDIRGRRVPGLHRLPAWGDNRSSF